MRRAREAAGEETRCAAPSTLRVPLPREVAGEEMRCGAPAKRGEEARCEMFQSRRRECAASWQRP